eukprot:5028344-Pleurochrysis_carterae.AAC.1
MRAANTPERCRTLPFGSLTRGGRKPAASSPLARSCAPRRPLACSRPPARRSRAAPRAPRTFRAAAEADPPPVGKGSIAKG